MNGPSVAWVLDFLSKQHMRALDAPISAIAITWYVLEQEIDRLSHPLGGVELKFSDVRFQILHMVQLGMISRSLSDLLETLHEARTNAAHVGNIERSKAQDFVNSARKALLMLINIPTPTGDSPA